VKRECPPEHLAWNTLPLLPAVATKLLAALDNEKISLAEVSRLINMDAAFTAEVLRLANSPVFPLRFEVVNVLHAVTVLGLARVRGLVLTVALRDCLVSMRLLGSRSRPGGIEELVRRCWRHNLATALASEALAERQWIDKSLAYTAGLLHDVGRLALIAADGQRYSEVVNDAAETGESLTAVERRVLGVDAAEAKRVIVETWKLPSALAGVSCRQSMDDGGGDAIGKVIGIACDLSRELGFAALKPSPEAACAPVTDADQAAAELTERVLTRLNMFECEFMQAA
jgi:HD-like signal output (HDOD) protein